MASAAAVAADEDRSPIANDIGEDGGRPGEITSGIYSKDEGLPDVNGDAQDYDDDDDDDVLPSNPLRPPKASRPANGGNVEDEDLFGEGEDGDAAHTEKPACVWLRAALEQTETDCTQEATTR